MTVYAVLDYQHETKQQKVSSRCFLGGCAYKKSAGRTVFTSLSSSIVHARPSLSSLRRLRSKAQPFIFSYAINCSAPLPTPTSASVVPR